MRKRIFALPLLTLAIMGWPLADFSAPQTLTKCRAVSKRLPKIVKGRPRTVPGNAPARSTVEYRTKMTAAMYVTIKMKESSLKMDLYSLDPSTIIEKNFEEKSAQFESGKEYVLVVNNCSGRKLTSFRLELTSN